jgi:pectate lyase
MQLADAFSLSSNTYFHDHYKACLTGHSDTATATLTEKPASYTSFTPTTTRRTSTAASRSSASAPLTSSTATTRPTLSASLPLSPEWESQIQSIENCNSLHQYENFHQPFLSSNRRTTLIESNVFVDIKDALTSEFPEEDGFAVTNGNDFGSSENSAPAGTLTSVPYEYTLLGSDNVQAVVVGTAGNTLDLG